MNIRLVCQYRCQFIRVISLHLTQRCTARGKRQEDPEHRGHRDREDHPGDVIDKNNYQKIEGLVPDFVEMWAMVSNSTAPVSIIVAP